MINRTWAFTVQPGYHQCPVCQAPERACHVFEAGGKRHVYCFRASCGAKASFPLGGSSGGEGIASPGASQEVLRPFTGYTLPIYNYPNVLDRFKQKYGFNPGGAISTCTYGGAPLIIPILAPNGSVRGHVEKTGLFPGEQKTNRIWKARHEPMISWTPGGNSKRTVLMVEDQISALKYYGKTGERAVALLGTNLTMEAIAEVQLLTDHLVIALDADATAKAFRLARKYGSAFKSCQVKILTKDIKDDSMYDSAHSGGTES